MHTEKRRLLIVSNRIPVTVNKQQEEISFQQSVGGLATGLSSIDDSLKTKWIGWPGISTSILDEDECSYIENEIKEKYDAVPVFLDDNDLSLFYEGFCNDTIWPLFHYFTQYVAYEESFWESYVEINRRFADAVLSEAKENDIIWIQDYHLMLLPGMIREKLPNATIGYFLHIPFPSFEIFRLLPWRKEILEGILGSDLIGFHIYDYARHFISSVHRVLGYEYNMNQLHVNDRVVRIDVLPMGVDYQKYAAAASSPGVKKELISLRENCKDCKVIVSIDRLDYSKGIPQRLEAYGKFLDTYPEYKSKVVFILLTVPSREEVDTYKQLKSQVDELVGSINGKHGTLGWVPVWILFRSVPFDELCALYNIADVCLITPLRDGMNLVAKEFVASKVDGHGVLVLSEMAGAARELGEALIVNPNNNNEIVENIKLALEMPESEQSDRNRTMQWRLKRYSIDRWASDFLDRMDYVREVQLEMKARKLTPRLKSEIVNSYSSANNRLIILDYDGTLIPRSKHYLYANPPESTIKIIDKLANDKNNTVVLVSGRGRYKLSEWFSEIDLNIVSEHGVWVKSVGSDWEVQHQFDNRWIEDILPIMEVNVDRTPGTYIEEKEHSLVWHYRNAESHYCDIRARELIDRLINLTQNMNLQVLEGDKYIEVKNAGVSKGSAVQRWIDQNDWDFVMAIGDDWTDEDVFSILPEDAFSIEVGNRPSLAKCNLDYPSQVLVLLSDLISS